MDLHIMLYNFALTLFVFDNPNPFLKFGNAKEFFKIFLKKSCQSFKFPAKNLNAKS